MGGRQRGRLGVLVVVVLGVAGADSACTTGPGGSPRPGVEEPGFTTVAEGPVPVRLDLPEKLPGEVSRLTVRLQGADGFTGSSTVTAVTLPGERYRLTGRCVSQGAGGVLGVDVMGPVRGAADGAPSEPAPEGPVASVTFACDDRESSVLLPVLPAGSSDVVPNATTRSVAGGWVVLARVR